MKKKFSITMVSVVAAFLLLSACSTIKPTPTAESDVPNQDSTEYKMVVFDPGFESWYDINASAATERSLQFYRNMNQQYVGEWNHKALSGHHHLLFASTINYDQMENYPLEIEKKLYYYFRYVESELKIPILRRR